MTRHQGQTSTRPAASREAAQPYAVCAIDALGISALPGRPVMITATGVITVRADREALAC
jgi:hypothetical protein